MSKAIKLKKGYNIKIQGAADKKMVDLGQPVTFAVKPENFNGIIRPKVTVKEGDTVKAGSVVFFDKKNDSVKYTAPVSGEVVEIVRGNKRKLKEVVIRADKEISYEAFEKYSVSDVANLSKEQAAVQMKNSGVWVNIIERPFGVVANSKETPKAIFISAFDSAPLAPDYGFILKGEENYFQTGIDVLKKFTSGTVHLNIDAEAEVSQIFAHAKNVQLNKFSGPHPAGNVGVQIHHLDPINKGDIVWTVNPYGVTQIGKLFLEGKYDASRKIAIAGSEVEKTGYVETFTGANIESFVKGNLISDNVRYIAGNVLTGTRIEENGHLGYHDTLLTVIVEGNQTETLGWLMPQFNKPSFHKAFGLMAGLSPNKEFRVNTNTNGDPKPFVVTGMFEKVLPMDVLPTYLLKAILAEDFDEIEALGIYEVIEEDLALCEFVDVSKHDIQAILREGLDLIKYS